MNKGRIISGLAIGIVAVFALFEVDFVFDVAGSGEELIADPDIEAAYEECYAARDEEIHSLAFGTIDNPEVQKEFITSNRVRAAGECRVRHPEKLISVKTPARFNLVDLRPRFW